MWYERIGDRAGEMLMREVERKVGIPRLLIKRLPRTNPSEKAEYVCGTATGTPRPKEEKKRKRHESEKQSKKQKRRPLSESFLQSPK